MFSFFHLPTDYSKLLDKALDEGKITATSQHDNNYILSDNMKVNEEYSDSRSNCSNSTTSLNVEIWDENKLEEENKGDDVSTTVTNDLFGISLVKCIFLVIRYIYCKYLHYT